MSLFLTEWELVSVARQCPPTHCVTSEEAKHEVVKLHHLSYSSDLAPTDSILFSKLKTVIRGTHLMDVEDIKKSVAAALKSLLREDYKGCFHKLYSRAQKCVTTDGVYFESYGKVGFFSSSVLVLWSSAGN